MNAASARLGTSASVFSSIKLIAGLHQMDGSGGRDASGVKPAVVSRADRYIEKHPACAAPISSSGLVPGLRLETRSKRKRPFVRATAQLHGAGASLSDPFHSADEIRIAIAASFLECMKFEIPLICLWATP